MQINAKLLDNAKQVYSINITGNVMPADIRQVTSTLNAVLESKARHIVVVFEQCTWVSAYFVRVLFSFFLYIKRCGGNFIIVNTDTRLTNLLEAYSLPQVIPLAASEIDAFDMVYEKSDPTGVDIKVKTSVLDRVELRIKEEDAAIREGRPLVPGELWKGSPAVELQEIGTLVINEPTNDTDTIVRDVHDFEATVEMSLEEMGFMKAAPRSATPVPGGLPGVSEIGVAGNVSTGDNPVQFIDVQSLSLDKNTAYEKEIREQSERFAKEAPSRSRPGRERNTSVPGFDGVVFRRREAGREADTVPAVPGTTANIPDLLAAVPQVPIVHAMRRLAARVADNLKTGNDVVAVIDTEVIASGVTGWILKLIEAGCLSGVVFSFLAALKDFETTFSGRAATRKEEIFQGTFGISQETFELFNRRMSGKDEPSLVDLFSEMIAGMSGTAKERSILYRCLESGLWTAVAEIESSPALSTFDRYPDAAQGYARMAAVMSRDSAATLLLPANGDASYALLLNTVQLVVNRGGSCDDGMIGCFTCQNIAGPAGILAACGVDAVHIDGDPGFMFPIFAESILGAVKR